MYNKPALYSFNTTQYLRLSEVGILPARGTELIAGQILEKPKVSAKHAAIVNRNAGFFIKLLDEKALVSIQNPIVLNEHSEPEADVAVFKPRSDFYESGKPGPADVYFVIEVSDSTYRYDVKVKLPLYAQSGIPETWIVNLNKNQLEVYTDLNQGLYRTKKIYLSDDAVVLPFFDITVSVKEILG